MTTLKVNLFSELAAKELARIEAKINSSIEKDALVIESINFELFTCDFPYQGELKNKIFFTYSDHYSANSGTWMNVSKLHHPHTNWEDRGYIKGVATDLDGYMAIKGLFMENLCYDCLSLHCPSFRKSAHSAEYWAQIATITNNFNHSVKLLEEKRQQAASDLLKSKTNLSLKYYIRNL